MEHENGFIKYQYPVAELDRIIAEMEKGARPMLTDLMKQEVELRKRELIAMTEGLDDDEEEGFDEIKSQHDKILEKIEEESRKATKATTQFRPLTKEQEEELEEDISGSYVRDQADSSYNQDDSELYQDQADKELAHRVSRIRNIYYEPASYRQAILTIRDAVITSLQRDYPWMSYQDAVDEFNDGHIKYLGHIPKLFLGFGTKQVTDPKILAGIVDGSITVIDKQKDDDNLRNKRKKKHTGPGVKVDYSIITREERDQALIQYNSGMETPLSVVFKARSTIFNRLSMPFAPQRQQQIQPQIQSFDWLREGAGEEYYRLMNNIPEPSVASIMQSINADNDGQLNQAVMNNMSEFLAAMSCSDPSGQYQIPQQDAAVEAEAASIEATILDNLRRQNGL